jgi:hypothetical protein
MGCAVRASPAEQWEVRQPIHGHVELTIRRPLSLLVIAKLPCTLVALNCSSFTLPSVNGEISATLVRAASTPTSNVPGCQPVAPATGLAGTRYSPGLSAAPTLSSSSGWP